MDVEQKAAPHHPGGRAPGSTDLSRTVAGAGLQTDGNFHVLWLLKAPDFRDSYPYRQPSTYKGHRGSMLPTITLNYPN